MAWINQIANGINKAFKYIRPIPKYIPALLLLCEVKNRPGLSAIALASAIIKRLPEIGINTGANPDGTPNVVTKFVRIFVEEMITELKDNARIDVALGSNTITSTGVGVGAAGPVTVTSQNILPIVLNGIIR